MKKTAKRIRPKCVGCGERTSGACPQCRKPTCGRSAQLCGHIEGICALCVAQRLGGKS